MSLLVTAFGALCSADAPDVFAFEAIEGDEELNVMTTTVLIIFGFQVGPGEAIAVLIVDAIAHMREVLAGELLQIARCQVAIPGTAVGGGEAVVAVFALWRLPGGSGLRDSNDPKDRKSQCEVQRRTTCHQGLLWC